MAAELLGDRLDLAGRHALHVHLGQRRHQRLLRALVALEQLGREAAVAVLRHPQLQLADPGDQRAVVVAAAVAEPRRRPLALLGAQRLGHLGLEQLLQDRLDQRPQEVPVLRQQRLHFLKRRPKLASGHGVHPSGDVEHHPHTMTPLPPALLQNLPYTTSHSGRCGGRAYPQVCQPTAYRLGPDIGTTLAGACVPCDDARHTQGFMKLPRHIPRLALRASSSAST